jgi:DNA polymerase-3 subunit delta'
MTAPYPWQAAIWQRLTASRRNGTASHALMFVGRAGLGKESLAIEYAKLLLCEAQGEAIDEACDTCRSCILFAAGNHPDLKLVAPAETGKAITIDQIREVTSYYELTSHYGRAKVTIVNPADDMNLAAANALLKILEEPPPQAAMILVTRRLALVPATIRSRCQRVSFDRADRRTMLEWLDRNSADHSAEAVHSALATSGGAPLAALDLLARADPNVDTKILDTAAAMLQRRIDAVEAGDRFKDVPLADLIDAWAVLAYRLIVLKNNTTPHFEDRPGPLDDRLQVISNHLHLKDLYRFLDLLSETKTLVLKRASYRDTDLVESMWLGFESIVHTT